VAKALKERLGGQTEERLGRALSDLLENPLLTGAIGRAAEARERAAQAQELAMGALNIPSAADIERLTRRLRSLSHRLEGIEDGVGRLDRAISPGGVEARLAAIERQLEVLGEKLDGIGKPSAKPKANAKARTRAKASSGGSSAAKASRKGRAAT
jgi:hypothetical protein